MEGNTMHYPYRPLEDSKHIRLLRIEAGKGEILCGLEHIPLLDPPPFDALSYTWGKGSIDHHITCDGATVSARQNLHDALVELRFEDRPRLLWVDAICINQQDVLEKNSQVLLMRQIYEAAQQVHVWLGAEDEETSRAFNTVELLAQCMDEYEREGHPWTSFVQHFMYSTGLTSSQWILYLGPFAKLLASLWFLRVWTLQEVVVGPLTRRAVIVCGSLRCWFIDLVRICEHWRMAGMMPFIVVPEDPVVARQAKLAITQLDCIGKMQRGVQGGKLLDTLSTLKVGRIRQATDPRDKIFGLIGLTVDCNNEALKPDYSLDTSTVYKRFAISYYRTTKNFEMFSICCLKKSPLPELDSLPSWAPDWSQNVEHDTFGTVEYHAGGLETQDVSFTESDQVLNATGVILDHVAHLGIGLKRDGDPSEAFSDLYANFAQWLEMTSDEKYYPLNTSPPPEEDVWRCLICDKDIKGRSAPSVYGQYYQQYVRFMHWLKDWWTRCGDHPQEPPSDEVAQYTSDGQSLYENSILTWAGTRKFCVTKAGRIGWVPPEAEVGDVLCVLTGAVTPHLLRADGNERYQLVGGSCYIQGQMEGEVKRSAEECVKKAFAIY